MSEVANRLRDRLRQRQTATEAPSQPLSLVQTGNPPSPSTHGHPQTLQNQELPTDNFLAEPELRTRFVRYFQFIASNIPMGTFSPMVQALSRRLFPLFAKELEKFSDEDIERTGVVALLTMAKLYRPNAERVVLDFAKGTMEVLGTEAVPPTLVEDEDRMLLEAADNELLTPPVPDFANMQVVDEDPIIGVQLPDGSVVQMRQADYLSLMKGGADNAVE